MAINKTIREKAYAKVNLGLDVLRKREDGYHEVKMIMQTIGICDELIISTSADTVGVNLLADVDTLPLDGTNLIVKAANLMMEKYNIWRRRFIVVIETQLLAGIGKRLRSLEDFWK